MLGDLRGKRVLHLQCNDGIDTLALAREGARPRSSASTSPTSPSRRRRARGAASGLPVRFERGDVLFSYRLDGRGGRAPASASTAFLASYGALCWISDLGRLDARRGRPAGAGRTARRRSSSTPSSPSSSPAG